MPPSPEVTSYQAPSPASLRSVPLSWVPPQNRGVRVGLVAMELNCEICSPLDASCGLFPRSTCLLLRSIQSTALSCPSPGVPGTRPPWWLLYQTPPSEPISVFCGLFGSKTTEWKSGCWSKPRFFQVAPPSSERKMPPDGGESV